MIENMTIDEIKDEIQRLKKMLVSERHKKVTKNGKYKFLSELQINSMDEYNPTIDLYKEYCKGKDNSNIRMWITPTAETDAYLVPGINVVAGQSGHGKSMVGNSVAYKAVRDGKNVLMISLEISKVLIFYQMISIHSRAKDTESNFLSHSRIKRHSLNKKEEEHAFNELWIDFNKMDGNLYVLDEWDFDYTSIESFQSALCLVEEYAQIHTGHGLDLIVIDYIQLFKEYKEYNIKNEYDSISKWVNDLRKISINFLGQNRGIAILLLSQLNREAMIETHSYSKAIANGKSNRGIRIGLSSIAGSVEIVKAASTVYAIYMDDSFKASNQCLIFLLKNRDGEVIEDGITGCCEPKYYTFGLLEIFDTIYTGTLDDLNIFGYNLNNSDTSVNFDLNSLSLDNLDVIGGNI